MKHYWKYLTLTLLLATQALFSTQALAASDPIYTGYFSSKALEGYDSVAYFTEGKPVKGNKAFKTTYQGADWLFSSQEHLDLFTGDPEKYAPQYGGYCAWALGSEKQLAPGDPLQWTVYNGKLYVNYDKSVKEKWLPNKDTFIKSADAQWPAILK
ncbi:YHS domain-containing (seleno)protein [Vibrio rumoiensis]|uniref:YHS domain protein n=1 Tax=Vibrio rumoiensis 1S-45 TaxID=1188252 RepID=A0A1E5E6A2_9VIBR|nr:YHS domain-containing (seleno)protein [Vibrio rumoiensis]OEF30026.1 YHS domain protein [Vibrio rumoiensis 1S-45]